jgi:hypothetical protein
VRGSTSEITRIPSPITSRGGPAPDSIHMGKKRSSPTA